MLRLDTSKLRIDPSQPIWTLDQAAAFLSVSPRYLRDTDCPRMRLPGRGPKRQALLRFVPAVVAAWAERWRTDAPEMLAEAA